MENRPLLSEEKDFSKNAESNNSYRGSPHRNKKRSPKKLIKLDSPATSSSSDEMDPIPSRILSSPYTDDYPETDLTSHQQNEALCSKNTLNNQEVICKTKSNLRRNYGGTSAVEQPCAEALASCTNNKKLTYSENCDRDRLSPVSGTNERSIGQVKTLNVKEMFHENEQNWTKVTVDGQEAGSSRRSSSTLESDHCHDLSSERAEREEKKRRIAMRKLVIATILSFLFMIGEIVGGYLAGSLAIMTDASHLLTDVSSFLISILAIKMAARPTSKKMTFGWHRAEVIGALISVLAIWVVTGVLVYLAVVRIVNGNYRVNGKDMLITASVAVGFNVIMGCVLHEHGHLGGHSHSHDHSHEHSQEHSQEHFQDHESDSKEDSSSSSNRSSSGNVNVRAAFIHVLGDFLQSLGVLTAALIIYFKPEYKLADPICTFLFSIFVLITTLTILKETVIVIMEGSPLNVEYNVVKRSLLEIVNVIAVHDIRIWSLTINQTVMSAHLVISRDSSPTAILKQATKSLKSLYDFHSLTLQVEHYSDDMDSCRKCIPA